MRRVEVWFDFAVPLCFAAHEASKAWEERGWELAWVPWETAPATPSPGRPRRADEAALGPEPAAAFEEHKLPFKASRLVPNSRVALRAAVWVGAHAGARVARDFREGVFRRLYERGLESHLANAEVLAGLVERAGLDPIEFLDDMRAGAGEAELLANGRRAQALGIAAAPAFAVDGRLLRWSDRAGLA